MKPLFFLMLLISFFGCKQEPPKEAKIEPTNSNYPEIDDISSKIADAPENSELYAARAKTYYEMEAYDEALKDIHKALEQDSANVHYLHLLSDIYLDYSKSRKALKTLEQAASYHPKRIPTLLKLGELQLILKMHDASFNTLGNIMQLDPLNAEAFYLAGRVYRDQGELDKAIATMQKAVDNEPDIVDAWMELADMHFEKSDPKAIQYYDAAIRVDTSYNFARFRKAFYLHQIGKLPEAIKQYREVTLRDYNFVDAYYNAGLAQMELGALEDAYNQFDIACKVDNTFLMAYYYRGLISEQMGNKKKAATDFATTLKLDPGFTRGEEALNRVKLETIISEHVPEEQK